MKNNKFAKITLVILTLALCLGTALAMSISADDTTDGPVIDSKNIMYSDKYALMYAVPASTVTEGASVTLYIHEAVKPTKDTLLTGKAYTVSAVTPADDPATEAVEGVGLDYDAYVFTTDGISAKAFDTQFYAVAQDNSTSKCSEVIRYSVAEYLYERLATTGANAPDTYQKKMYEGAIAFATGAQVSVTPKLNPTTDKDKLIENLRYVVVEGGTIDGYATGVYAIGTTLNPEVTGAIGAKWAVTTVDAAGKETVTNNNTSYKVIDAVKATLSVGTKIAYRDGTDTFDDDTKINTGYVWWTTGSANKNASLVEEGSRGNVLKVDFKEKDDESDKNYHVQFGINNTLAADKTATAFELSFDLKATSTSTQKTHDLQFGVRATKSDGSSGTVSAFRFGYYINESTGPRIISLPTTTYQYTAAGLKASDWNHIKMVVWYDEPTACYVYINGEFAFKNTITESADYTGSPSADRICQLQISCSDRTLPGTAYIDNVYVGEIADTKPAN